VHFATENPTMSAAELAQLRARLAASGRDMSQVSDADLQALLDTRARKFLDEAPMTAAEAATVILDGVKAGRWRILVGSDAHHLDEMVRTAPEEAYETGFYERFVAETGWRLGR
jgi:hypothetical protein